MKIFHEDQFNSLINDLVLEISKNLQENKILTFDSLNYFSDIELQNEDF